MLKTRHKRKNKIKTTEKKLYIYIWKARQQKTQT